MTAIEEIDNTFSLISTFHKSNSEYLMGTTSVLPTLDLSTVSYSELLTYVLQNLPNGASFALGSAQEAIYLAAALSRESDMGSATKSVLYSGLVSEANSEFDFYNQTNEFITSVVKGSPTNGSQC